MSTAPMDPSEDERNAAMSRLIAELTSLRAKYDEQGLELDAESQKLSDARAALRAHEETQSAANALMEFYDRSNSRYDEFELQKIEMRLRESLIALDEAESLASPAPVAVPSTLDFGVPPVSVLAVPIPASVAVPVNISIGGKWDAGEWADLIMASLPTLADVSLFDSARDTVTELIAVIVNDVDSRAGAAAYVECARIARERAILIQEYYNHESGPEKTANLIADEIESAALRAGVKP